MSEQTTTARGLYIHVPFCVRKCCYCDFYSLPNPRGSLGDPDAADYLSALEAELALTVPAGFRAHTVFVGGGTPTELGARDLERLLELVTRHAHPSSCIEWTLESNPGTLTREKARLLRQAGVTRVSMGVQSFDPRNLDLLGRVHTADEAIASFRLLRELGFSNLNLDLIFGIPGSDRERLERDLETLVELSPEHVACYCLIFEEGTPLAQLRRSGALTEVDDEEELAQYTIVRDVLRGSGYRHYEISNFARAGRECRHNLLYWGPGEYYGLGPAAHGHVSRARYANARSLRRYCDALLHPEHRPPFAFRDFEERLDPEAWAREALVMGLRRLEGVSRTRFRAETGQDLETLRGSEIERLVHLGLLEREGDSIRLSERGLFVSDSVFAELV